MTAKRMFEKLGYELTTDDQYCKLYNRVNDKYSINISFEKQDKAFVKFYYEEGGYLRDYTEIIDMKEFKAIQKELKELGWL